MKRRWSETAALKRVRKVIGRRAGNANLCGLKVLDVELVCRLAERARDERRPDNARDCGVCEGEGWVEATCNSCGMSLTKRNVAQPFGYEGDDVCKKCKKADEEFMFTKGRTP